MTRTGWAIGRPRRRVSTFLVACIVICGLAGFLACGYEEPKATQVDAAQPEVSNAPPNVLLYIVDTLRADALTPYGATPDRTPAIDEFARNAVVFENAFAPSSWTRASVASILTAHYPKAHGAQDRADRLGSSANMLSEIFSEHGYHTGLITTNPNVGKLFGFDQGFDDVVEAFGAKGPGAPNPNGMIATADDVAKLASNWLDKVTEPFFLVVLSVDPHSPYAPPPAFKVSAGNYKGEVDGSRHFINRTDLTAEDKAHIRSLYEGEVAYADHGFALVRKDMHDRGLSGRTISVLTSDHGEEFWEHDVRGHGKNLRNAALHVPLVIEAPEHSGIGRREARNVEIIDVFPTLLDLAALPIPDDISGHSLFAEATAEKSPIFASLRLDGRNQASVHDGNWKLVWDLDSDRKQLFDMRKGETAATSDAHSTALSKLLTDHLSDSERIRRSIHGDTAPDTIEVGELPDAERQLLIELGYIDDGASDPTEDRSASDPGVTAP